MYVDRLKRMAALLERDAADEKGVKFDLGFWAVPTDRVNKVGINAYWAEQAETVPVSCGTTACAMGLAAISGEFKAEGLEPAFYARGAGAGGFILVPRIKDRTGYKQDGFEAAEVLFDITGDDAVYLFDPDYYNGTPKGAEGELFVAQRIRDFIAGDIDYDYHRGQEDEDNYDEPEDQDQGDDGSEIERDTP